MTLTGRHNPFDVAQDAGRPKARGQRRARRDPGAPARTPRRDPREKVDEERDVVITPSEIDHRVDRIGRPYTWVRAEVKHRNAKPVERTVMIQGLAFEIFAQVLEMGSSFRIRGLRTHVRDDQGAPGAEIYRGFQILRVFSGEHGEGVEIDAATGEPVRRLAGHSREGHYRRQRSGPGGSGRTIVWIDGYDVNGGRLADDADLDAMFRD